MRLIHKMKETVIRTLNELGSTNVSFSEGVGSSSLIFFYISKLLELDGVVFSRSIYYLLDNQACVLCCITPTNIPYMRSSWVYLAKLV